MEAAFEERQSYREKAKVAEADGKPIINLKQESTKIFKQLHALVSIFIVVAIKVLY